MSNTAIHITNKYRPLGYYLLFASIKYVDIYINVYKKKQNKIYTPFATLCHDSKRLGKYHIFR